MAYGAMPQADFTIGEITEAVRIGVNFFYRNEALEVSAQDVARITAGLIARYDCVRKDDITRRSLNDEIVREMNKLLDARDMEAIGAVPIVEGKLHPIEDEV